MAKIVGKLRRGVMAGLSVLLTVFCTSAQGDTVWDMDSRDLLLRLRRGDTAFLKQLSYSKYDLQEPILLHNGAYYYLYTHYKKLELSKMQENMLLLAWERGEDPWRYEAGLRILRKLSREKRYSSVERLASEGLLYYNNDPRYLSYYLEALYWLKKDATFYGHYSKYISQLNYEDAHPFWRDRPRQTEAQLWKAVVDYRNKRAGFSDLFTQLFYDQNAQSYHTRAYLYIDDEPILKKSFTGWQLTLFRAKHLVNQKKYSQAASAWQQAIEEMPADQREPVWQARTVRDAARSFYYSNKSAAGIKLLSSIAEDVPGGAARAAAQEWLGRIYRKSANNSAAYRSFIEGSTAQPSDRLLWLAFDAAFSRSKARGIEAMMSHGSRIRNERYYSDIFERYSSLAIRTRDWNLLWDLRKVANAHGAPYDKARLAVLVAEAVRSGATKLSRTVNKDQLRRDLEYARTQTESSFYAHLAAHMLNKSARRNYRLPRRSAAPALPNPHNRHNCRKMIDGYLIFGLYNESYQWVGQCADRFETQELIDYARTFNKSEKYNYSIRIMDIARRRSDFIVNVIDARLLYPQGYNEYIDSIAAKHSIPPILIYATVREESYFAPDVRSHAGAVGLAQIIPRTARAVAKRMQIPTPDLTVPAHNLALGGFHIRELLDSFSQRKIPALAAYNAGPGRVRQWERNGAGLSSLLVHESFHIFETRHYIRKILVTSLNYNRLYANASSYRMVRSFYPDLGRY